MSYDQDPARWSTDPDQAPEALRGAFSAGRNEGPDRTQMRALAVKLAAASAGGAVAVGTVKAASAGNTIATAATWSAAKIAGVIAVAGGIVTSAAVWGSGPHDAKPVQAPMHAERSAESAAAPAQPLVESEQGAQQAAPSANGETARAPQLAPTVSPIRAGEPASQAQDTLADNAPEARANAARSTNTAAAGQPAARSADTSREAASKPARRTENSGARSKSAAAARSSQSSSNVHSSTTSGTVAPPSEISLLRSAQVALAARPREAFQLTQQHRRLYPAGEFAQERDALAIQALMRSGESEQARDLAQAFIRAYPSSPHAHRFREAMGIR
jgi:hypothetical protein